MTVEYEYRREPPFEIKGRGWAYPVYLKDACKREDLKQLIGQKFFDQHILGIESFCIEYQRRGIEISLLVKQPISFK